MAINCFLISDHPYLISVFGSLVADDWSLTSTRGTSAPPRHTRLSRYRCSLPGLAGFAGPRCTEPEVPRFGSQRLPDCKLNLNIPSCTPVRFTGLLQPTIPIQSAGLNYLSLRKPVCIRRAPVRRFQG